MFDILSSHDFLQKLESDFDDFIKESHSTRLALNCAITAYHLHEWVWGDWLKTDSNIRKTLRIRDYNDFLKWIDDNCPWFSTVQELTNGTKHFRTAQGFKAERVDAPPFMWDELSRPFGNGR
jgi:hypothetical protein